MARARAIVIVRRRLRHRSKTNHASRTATHSPLHDKNFMFRSASLMGRFYTIDNVTGNARYTHASDSLPHGTNTR